MSDCVDFGIIPNIEYDKDYSETTFPGSYQDLYEKYHCISVPDDIFNDWILSTYHIPTYIISLSRPYMGIDHWGVTLIPPESVKMLLDVVRAYITNVPDESMDKLVTLLRTAIEQNRYVICFGI